LRQRSDSGVEIPAAVASALQEITAGLNRRYILIAQGIMTSHFGEWIAALAQRYWSGPEAVVYRNWHWMP
jgi:hypothetical protein